MVILSINSPNWLSNVKQKQKCEQLWVTLNPLPATYQFFPYFDVLYLWNTWRNSWLEKDANNCFINLTDRPATYQFVSYLVNLLYSWTFWLYDLVNDANNCFTNSLALLLFTLSKQISEGDGLNITKLVFFCAYYPLKFINSLSILVLTLFTLSKQKSDGDGLNNTELIYHLIKKGSIVSWVKKISHLLNKPLQFSDLYGYQKVEVNLKNWSNSAVKSL